MNKEEEKRKRLGSEIGRREAKGEVGRLTGHRWEGREGGREGRRKNGSSLEDKSTIFIERRCAYPHLFFKRSFLILNDQIQLSILY